MLNKFNIGDIVIHLDQTHNSKRVVFCPRLQCRALQNLSEDEGKFDNESLKNGDGSTYTTSSPILKLTKIGFQET